MPNPEVTAFFDEKTHTVSYVVADSQTKQCVVIDPVLDYDRVTGRTATASVEVIIQFISANKLRLERVLETHVHADHLSAAPVLKQRLQAETAIGSQISVVQAVFRDIFNLDDMPIDGSQFDQLLAEGDQFLIGNLQATVMHTPGHTPACVSYVIGDAAFVGDTLFMPDFGTARCDFPGGDASVLYDSIQKILELGDATRLFMCHDYKAPGRDEYAWESSVREQRKGNVHVHAGVTKQDFVKFRQQRDASLSMPKLIIPSIQVNICAGNLPEPESNGVSYLKVPLNVL